MTTAIELPEENVLAAILVLFPNAELSGDEDGQLVINTNCMYTGKHGENIIGTMNIGGGEGTCFRCNLPVTSQVEVVWLDGELRNDCPESEDGMPHEVEAPDGWDDE